MIENRTESWTPKGLVADPEVEEALCLAYEWAKSKADTSMYAGAAKVYIEAIKLNRLELPDNPNRADHTQFLYIISNLTYWRGKDAKKSREVLKEYAKKISAS